MTTIEGAATAKALMQATISSTLLKKAFDADQEFAEEIQKTADDPPPIRAAAPAPEVKVEAPPPPPPPKSSQSVDIIV